MLALTGLDQITPLVREPVRTYAERVLAYGGDRVRCLALVGMVVGADFESASDTIESVLVMQLDGLDALRGLAQEGHRFGRSRITAPTVLTPEFLAVSRDTYPLELLEIQQQHLLISGEDVFSPLVFDSSHVRLQCERQLKVIALAMRQVVVKLGMQQRALRDAVLPLLADFRRVLRGLMWLKGIPCPPRGRDMLARLEELIGRKLPGAQRMFESPRDANWADFEQFYSDVNLLDGVIENV
jgi:hypothetical protein